MKKIIYSLLLISSTSAIADIQVPATVISSYKMPDVCEKTGDFASTALGAVAGAAIGSQFGDGNGKDIMTATGAIVGANIANSEKYNCYSKGFSTTIQFYDPYLGYTRNEVVNTNYSYSRGSRLYYVVPEPYYPTTTYYTYPQYNKYVYSRPNNVIINIDNDYRYKHHNHKNDRREHRYYNRHDRRDDRHDNRHDRRDNRHDNRHDRRDDRHDNRHDRRDDRHDNRHDRVDERKEQPVHKEEKRQWRQEVYKKDEN